MADIVKFKSLLDLYGVGVRAGTFTPQIADEAYFRDLAGLPEMSDATKADWAQSGGVRQPITLLAPDVEDTRDEE